MTTTAKIVLCTVPNNLDSDNQEQQTARRIAQTLVSERWAACVNLLPAMQSVYCWQENIEESSEVQLLIKTDQHHLDGLMQRLRELHPYQTPEILVIDIAHGDKEYLTWLSACLH
ncbi:MAG: divalent-cation tolerance protein CutA [Plesiomonas sp.]